MTTDKRLYDTRFFSEYFYSENPQLVKKLKEELKSTKERLVSSLTIHEFYRIVLKTNGKETAMLRSSTIQRDCQIIDVNYEIAIKSAQIRHKHPMPMADSVIAATAQIHDCTLFTDDTHFKNIENLKTTWHKTS
jgi:toxin FitB